MNVMDVWHGEKHDDCTVTEVSTLLMPHEWTQQAKNEGGFWWDSKFVPFHRINYIVVTQEADERDEPDFAARKEPI